MEMVNWMWTFLISAKGSEPAVKQVLPHNRSIRQNATSTYYVRLSSSNAKVSGGVLRGGSELTSGSLSGLP